MPISAPIIGIVGSAGAYGQWLAQFLERRMGLPVIGHDPSDSTSLPPTALVKQAHVLVFSTPIQLTEQVIAHYVQLAAGQERGQLWLDLTSIKTGPVAAMLASQAEVVGLHPTTAPPPSPTLKGRPMVVCEARLDQWRPWLTRLLDALEAQCVYTTPLHHDKVMALVQAMVHAVHLAEGAVLRAHADELGGLADLLAYRTASFEMDGAILARMLALNPAIYEDIQFGNPYVPAMLDRLIDELATLRALVAAGDQTARHTFRQRMLANNRAAIGPQALSEGHNRFERIGGLLADLSEPHTLSVYLPLDRAGSLRALLQVLERHGISIASLHSLRNSAGQLHFRLGFDSAVNLLALEAAAVEVETSGIGQVVERPSRPVLAP